MDITPVTLALLVATAALNFGHVAVHVMTTLVRKRPDLPWYDKWVGYLGAMSWFLMVWADRGTLTLPHPSALILGLGLTGAGLAVHGAGVLVILDKGGEGALVTQGIYARLRHPIYYGWVLVSFGMPLVTDSWWGLATAPLWSVLILMVGRMEERDMRRRFPEGEYEEYMGSTWF